jgi:formylglycine-generating enzyme required for sulfatase activity
MKNTATVAFVSLMQFCIPAAYADTFGSGANRFDIKFVSIGDPGNPEDIAGGNPIGKVAYAYRMGKYEVSRDMITKANNEGGLGITMDPMSFVTGGARADMPATGVTWNEAARFVNWLNTSNGFSPAYKFATQPGDVGYDSNADILLWDPADAGYDSNNLFRNQLARYVLPKNDEWHKAAYYDPNAGVYYDYPTGSDTVPTAVAGGTAAGTAVYGQPFSQGPADITLAGGLSPYGTMAQGGNVWEWSETNFETEDPGFPFRYTFGSSWEFVNSYLRRGSSVDQIVWDDVYNITLGFRVASVPEPSALLLGAMAGFGVLLRRTRNG